MGGSNLLLLVGVIFIVTSATCQEVDEPPSAGKEPYFVPVEIRLAEETSVADDPSADPAVEDPPAADNASIDEVFEELPHPGFSSIPKQHSVDLSEDEAVDPELAAASVIEDPAAAVEDEAAADPAVGEEAVPAVEKDGKTEAKPRPCNYNFFQHYSIRGCSPVYEAGAGESDCPLRYDCLTGPETGRKADKCYYKGVEYNLGDDMLPLSSENPCVPNCRCQFGGEFAEPECSHVDCFGQRTPAGCRKTYKPDRCCSEKTVCESPTEGFETLVRTEGDTCTWEGKTFQLGDKIYLDDFEDTTFHCTTCVCTEEFTGPTGPGCKNFTCGLGYSDRKEQNDGCIPIYRSCCFHEWMCPGDERIDLSKLPNPTKLAPSPEETSFSGCRLDWIKIAVGEDLPLKECSGTSCFRCLCSVPPQLTCAYNKYL